MRTVAFRNWSAKPRTSASLQTAVEGGCVTLHGVVQFDTIVGIIADALHSY